MSRKPAKAQKENRPYLVNSGNYILPVGKSHLAFR